jgi:PHP N-domain protein
LSGIEVELEGGHILGISNNDDALVDEFAIKRTEIHTLIPDKRTYITFEQFYGIFSDFSSSVLILHYDKSSQLCNDAILKFSDEILAGEVTSVKKLIYI